MIEGLDNGRVALLSAIRTVSDNLATRRPAVDKWSILECVEHVAVAEEYLLAQILAATHYGTPVINKQREAAIQVRGLDRTRRIESPDVAKRGASRRWRVPHNTSYRVAQIPCSLWRVVMTICVPC